MLQNFFQQPTPWNVQAERAVNFDFCLYVHIVREKRRNCSRATTKAVDRSRETRTRDVGSWNRKSCELVCVKRHHERRRKILLEFAQQLLCSLIKKKNGKKEREKTFTQYKRGQSTIAFQRKCAQRFRQRLYFCVVLNRLKFSFLKLCRTP